MKSQRTVLVTFAGRRDRMGLLTRYVQVAIERGLIDEWHVWDFSRNIDDSRWLRETFPVTQSTPNNSFEYFRLPKPLSARSGNARLSFQVRANHDVHIGLRRLSGIGPCYEIVLGGWNNSVSAIRKFDDPAMFCDVATRERQPPPAVAHRTPGILPEFGFSQIEIEIGESGLKTFVGGNLLMLDNAAVPSGDFEIEYRTGFGSNGDWSFPEFGDHRSRLFIAGAESHHPANSLFYTRAYQYYASNRDQYARDILLKCDDDIVYFDLERLAEFISFRRENPEYFLVSANVVNNGVCAYFQQASGAIPLPSVNCELPHLGLGGSLWRDGAKAEAVHRLFLKSPASFAADSQTEIIWNERLSINFIALLGSDLVHIPDVTYDDEHEFCYSVRKRARKQNCIYPRFLASHLSFWPQDAAMNIREMLSGYEELAANQLSNSYGDRRAA